MTAAPESRATATEETLAAYFDSLLLEGGQLSPPPASAPPDPRPVPAPATASAAPLADQPAPVAPNPRYRLVRALGLTLALPETGIVELIPTVALTAPAPGTAAWSAGAIAWRERRIPVVDPAAWLLPAAQRAALPGAPAARVPAAVVIAGGRLAIGCESVSEPVPVDPAGVNWRKAEPQGRRPWLAGTIPDKGWVVIDPAALYEMLAGTLA